MRKALIGSFLFHAALATSVYQWVAIKSATDLSQSVYQVELVDGARTANTVTVANVDPAALQAPPREEQAPSDKPDRMPDSPAQKKPDDNHDLAATTEVRRTAAKPDSNMVSIHTGHLRVASTGTSSRFAIDAPAGEPGPDPVGDLEARGSLSQPLHVTHPGSYTETYVILRAVKPKYPDHERERGIEGSVTVELLVDEQGMVSNADVLELVGPMSFQNSALDAVRQFEFQAPIENGLPTTMWIKFVIKFRINS